MKLATIRVEGGTRAVKADGPVLTEDTVLTEDRVISEVTVVMDVGARELGAFLATEGLQ